MLCHCLLKLMTNVLQYQMLFQGFSLPEFSRSTLRYFLKLTTRRRRLRTMHLTMNRWHQLLPCHPCRQTNLMRLVRSLSTLPAATHLGPSPGPTSATGVQHNDTSPSQFVVADVVAVSQLEFQPDVTELTTTGAVYDWYFSRHFCRSSANSSCGIHIIRNHN